MTHSIYTEVVSTLAIAKCIDNDHMKKIIHISALAMATKGVNAFIHQFDDRLAFDPDGARPHIISYTKTYIDHFTQLLVAHEVNSDIVEDYFKQPTFEMLYNI